MASWWNQTFLTPNKHSQVMTDALAIAIVTSIAGVIAGFFKLIDNQNKLHEKLAISIDRMAESSDKVAAATVKGNREAEKRNGHLAEITVQQGDRIANLLTSIKEQRVEHQHVEKETVEIKEG